MASRFWVVGADYAECDLNRPMEGSQSLHGPFNDELHARMEWQRLTFRDHTEATRRYSIAVEGRGFGG